MVLRAINPRQFIDTPCARLGSLREVGIHPAKLKDASCSEIELHGPPREIKRYRTLGLFSKPEVLMMIEHCRGHVPPTRGANAGPSEHIYLWNINWKCKNHIIGLTDKKTLMAWPRSSNL